MLLRHNFVRQTPPSPYKRTSDSLPQRTPNTDAAPRMGPRRMGNLRMDNPRMNPRRIYNLRMNSAGGRGKYGLFHPYLSRAPAPHRTLRHTTAKGWGIFGSFHPYIMPARKEERKKGRKTDRKPTTQTPSQPATPQNIIRTPGRPLRHHRPGASFSRRKRRKKQGIEQHLKTESYLSFF